MVRVAIVVSCLFLMVSCSSGGLSTSSSSELSRPLGSGSTLPSSTSLDPTQPATVYISVGKARQIRVLELGIDGQLTDMPDQSLELPGTPGAMVYSESKRQLVAGVGNGIAVIPLDDAGKPSLGGILPVSGEPVYLDLAASDERVFAAYFGEDEVRSYTFGNSTDKSEPLVEAQVVASKVEPHAVYVNQAGDRAYVPQRNGDSIGVYTVGEDGSLAVLEEVPSESGSGPRHITFSPDERFAYVVNENSSSVTSFAVNDDGGLGSLQTVSTTPDDGTEIKNTGADIQITPDGAFVYASNRGRDSIAAFAVGGDGELTPLGHTLTQKRPRDFSISPDGRFLVVAGQDSGSIESFTVGADGSLTSNGTQPVGDGPVWVTIV